MRARPCVCFAGLASAFVSLLVPAREAAAQSLEVEPGACVDAPRLAAALEEIDARVPASRKITVRVAEAEGRVSFEIREGEIVLGGRTIATHDLPCDEVLSAVAVAIAVTTDASLLDLAAAAATIRAAPPAPAPMEHHAPRLPPSTPPSDAPGAAPTEGTADRGARRLAASVELGWALGMLPKSSAALAAMVDVAIGPPPIRGAEPELSTRAGFVSALPSGTGDTGLEGAEIVTSVFAGRLDLCGGVGGSAVRLRGCASAVGGGLVTEGGDDEGRLLAGGRVDLRWRATERVGFQAGADMLASLGPVSVTSRDGDGRIDHRMLAPFALLVGGGPVVEFF